jgi:FtsZ-binding cell division protein ZapB
MALNPTLKLDLSDLQRLERQILALLDAYALLQSENDELRTEKKLLEQQRRRLVEQQQTAAKRLKQLIPEIKKLAS